MSHAAPAVRRTRRALAVLAASLLLASCRVDQTVTLAVKPNGSGEVRVAVTADAAVVAAAPNLAADVRTDDLVRAGWKVSGPSETDDGGLRIELTRPFDTPTEATAVLAQVNGANGPLQGLSLARAGKDTNSVWTLTGTLRVAGGLDAFIDDAGRQLLGGAPFAGDVSDAGLDLGEAVGIEFIAELPGKIDSTSGLERDGAIVWRVPMDGSQIDVATGVTNVDVPATVAGVGRGVLRFLLALWIAGVIALLATVWVKNRPRTPRI